MAREMSVEDIQLALLDALVLAVDELRALLEMREAELVAAGVIDSARFAPVRNRIRAESARLAAEVMALRALSSASAVCCFAWPHRRGRKGRIGRKEAVTVAVRTASWPRSPA